MKITARRTIRTLLSNGSLLAITLILMGVTQRAQAQWNPSPSPSPNTNIYYNAGNVGVGTSSPNFPLEVSKSQASGTYIQVTNSNTSAGNASGLRMFTSTNNALTLSAIGNAAAGGYASINQEADLPLLFMTNNTERMRIAAGGNVGIGTSSPNLTGYAEARILSISRMSSPTSQAVIELQGGDGTSTNMHMGGINWFNGTNRNAYLGAGADGGANSGNFQFYTTNGGTMSERMRIDKNGYVGIGTTNPLAQIHLGTATSSGLKTYTSSATDHGFLFNSYIDTNSPYRRYGDIVAMSNQDGTSGGSTIRFLTNSNTSFSAVERMRIDYLGNVGIGTAPASAYKLDVNGTINATNILINGAAISGGSSQWASGTNSISYSAGNVGVGTTTPALKLHVSNGGSGVTPSGLAQEVIESNAAAGLHIVNPDNQIARVMLGTPSASNGLGISAMLRWDYANKNFDVATDQTNGYIRFLTGQFVERMRIDTGGNVGIGTSNPQSTLQIGGQGSSGSNSPVTLSLGGTYSNSAGANLKLKLYDDGVAANTYGLGVSSASMDFAVSPTGGYHWYAGTVNKMTLSNSGDLTVSGSIVAKYQDVAEWVPSSEQVQPGTVVVLDQTKSNQVISSKESYDTRVAGVVSERPGLELGERGADKVLVATTGRVMVKVDASRGPIHIGDLLVTSDIPGLAMKSEPINVGGARMHRPGTLIGKALEPLEKGSGKILVLLSLQ